MMSSELDLCYVESTDLIQNAVRHVLSVSSCDEKLRKELKQWQQLSLVAEGEGGKDPGIYCRKESCISFELIVSLHQQLQKTPLASGPIYLHELVNGSSFCLPEVRFPPRNPELVAKLERIQAKADNKAYKRMVKNVDVSRDDSEFHRLGLEVQATSRQIYVVLNFVLTVVGSSLFGYFAAYYAGYSTTACVFIALICGIVVFLADMYFIVRTDLVPPKLPASKPQIKQKKD